MPRYERSWLEIAQEQYDSLPATTRRLVDRRVEELLDDPTGNPDATYYRRFDEWIIPFGADEGFISYAVVEEPRRLVILRRVIFLG
ncbi:MAG: hypothetical protein M3Y73_15275 [Actinomycetota bacterium]|nr:hypothetical protein [Actinomycetota bacterium]